MPPSMEKTLTLRNGGDSITFRKGWVGSLEVDVASDVGQESFNCSVRTEEVIEWLNENFPTRVEGEEGG